MEIRKKINIDLPKDVITLKNGFIDNNKKLFLVGGSVRDSLLGIKPKDFDLATDAKPDEVKIICSELGFKTLETGEHFGVINVIGEDDVFEIATFRIDSSQGRKPSSVEFTDINGDVTRRDLTINALFFDIDTSEVGDLGGGLFDLETNTVRAVGDASERIKEDKLRILRAVRFISRFDSDIDHKLFTAIVNDNTKVCGDGSIVSNERIRDEFLKAIKSSSNIDLLIELFDKLDLFKWVFDDLKININSFMNTTNPILLISSLLGKNKLNDVINVLKEKTFTNDEIKSIKFLLSLDDKMIDIPDIIKIKKSQKHISLTDDEIKSFLKHVKFPMIEEFINFKLTVNGDDALNAGIEVGPNMGEFIFNEEVRNFKKLIL